MKGPQKKTLDDVNMLLAFAQKHCKFKHEHVEMEYGWTHSWFEYILHLARKVLSDDGKYITCHPDPDAPWGSWLYKLTDDQPSVRDWSVWGLGYMETYLKSQRDAWSSQVESKGLHTEEGRKAYRLVKDIDRTLEDVVDISNEATIERFGDQRKM